MGWVGVGVASPDGSDRTDIRYVAQTKSTSGEDLGNGAK